MKNVFSCNKVNLMSVYRGGGVLIAALSPYPFGCLLAGSGLRPAPATSGPPAATPLTRGCPFPVSVQHSTVVVWWGVSPSAYTKIRFLLQGDL